MSILSDALGLGPEFTFEDKVYRLKPLTPVHLAMFSAWLERQAYESVERNRGVLSADGYKVALGSVAERAATQEFAFGSEAYAKASASLEGMKYMILLSLKDNHPEADEQFVDRLFAEKLELIKTITARTRDVGGG